MNKKTNKTNKTKTSKKTATLDDIINFNTKYPVPNYEAAGSSPQPTPRRPPNVSEHSFDCFVEALRSQGQANLQNSLALSKATEVLADRDMTSRRGY